MPVDLHAPVVVGVNGTEESRRAAVYGGWEAQRHTVPLRLVYAFESLVPTWGPANILSDLYEWEQDNARAVCDKAAKEVALHFPDLPVEIAAIDGSPAGVLVAQSRHADMIVVATRAAGGLTGHLSESVASQLTAYASAPVLILRPEPENNRPGTGTEVPGGGPVVVGVDGSPPAHAAMEFGVQEALARGVGLVAVLVRNEGSAISPGSRPGHPSDSRPAATASRLLTDATEQWSDRYPNLAISHQAIHDSHPVRALVRAAGGASLIVVGARGRGGFLGLRIGSTADGLIRHAGTTVAVVRDEYPDHG